jgi:predicted metal-dependent hydrolase
MNIIEESFKRLYPEREFNYICEVDYTDRFKPFNSNIKLSSNKISLNLSKSWRYIDSEIKIGLIQELLIKIFKTKKPWEQNSQGAGKMHAFFPASSKNIDLYNDFIRNLSKVAPKTLNDPILENSFHRINDKYFYNTLEKPNLKFGNRSFSRLGTYEYATDTITISLALKDDFELLDYVMYHEMLHKKHQFTNKNGRNYHHTSLFREKERAFDNSELMEKRLKRLRIKEFLPKWGFFRKY